MSAPPPLVRRRLLGASALGLVSTFLPAASAAASESFTSIGTYGCSDAPWAIVPFLEQGESASVSGTTVGATENSAVQGYNAFVHLHQSTARIRTVLRFTPSITALRVLTENHDDGVSERYDFSFLRSGAVVASEAIQHLDTTRDYTVELGFDTLTIDYSHPDTSTFGAYGSFLTLWIPCE